MSVRNALDAEETAKKFMTKRFGFKDEECSAIRVGFDGTFFTVHLLAETTNSHNSHESKYLIKVDSTGNVVAWAMQPKPS
jgi:hypothetical protein